MSRTYKDKARTQGGLRSRAYRAILRERRERFEKAQANAIKAGIPCVRCFIFDGIQKGLRCAEHGGGIRTAILKRAGIPDPDKGE